jgi:hypothetical protein
MRHDLLPDSPMRTQQTKTKLRFLGALIFSIWLSGCATMYSPAEREDVAKMKRVGVVSVVGSVFTRQYTGLTVFNNEYETLDVSVWDLDAVYEDRLRNELTKKYGIDAVTPPFSTSEMQQIDMFIDPWSAPLLTGGPTVDVPGALHNYCNANMLDGVLILNREARNDPGTNQYFGGPVVYTRLMFGSSSSLYMIARLTLLDCASGKRVVTRWLSSDQASPLTLKKFFAPGNPQRGLPWRPFDKKLAMTPLAQWTPEELKQVYDKLIVMTDRPVEVTLRSIFAQDATTSAQKTSGDMAAGVAE